MTIPLAEEEKIMEDTERNEDGDPDTLMTGDTIDEENRKLMEMGQLRIEDEPSFVSPLRNEARKFTQIFAVLAVSFGCYIHGTTVVYTAVANPSIIQANGTDEILNGTHPLPFLIYQDDINLFTSISSFGMLAGSLFAGPLANLIGRKWTCIVGTCGNLALGYALIAGGQNVWMFFIGRFFSGSGLGFSTAISTLYIIEIATPTMRGGLAVVPAIAGCLGVLTCQCLGAYLDWLYLSIVLAALNIPFFIMLLFIPETPVYLIGTDQIERAHKVLRFLRGRTWDVTKELTDLKVASEGKVEAKVSWRRMIGDFLQMSVLKPFLMAITLMFFFQFSGINIIMQYTVKVFVTAGSSIDAFKATIFVGMALFVSNTFTLFVVTKMRRRLMLLLSSLGISVNLVAMGVYYYLKALEKAECGGQTENCPEIYTADVGWLPAVFLMLYIFFFNLGYGAMIWITVAEILPLHVRSVTNSIAVATTAILSFLTSHTYNELMKSIQGQGVFWFYGSVSLLGFFFILVFVPETKNKTEAEIQEFFLPKAERKRRQEARKNKEANSEAK